MAGESSAGNNNNNNDYKKTKDMNGGINAGDCQSAQKRVISR
jgi:hypothetical protein